METEILIRHTTGGKTIVLLKLNPGKTPTDLLMNVADIERFREALRTCQSKMVDIEKLYEK